MMFESERPTQAEIIKWARATGVDPIRLAFHSDLDFHKLEPGDMAGIGPHTQAAIQFLRDDKSPSGPPSARQGVNFALVLGVVMIFVSVAVVHIWARWSS